jgi:dTMP kinase
VRRLEYERLHMPVPDWQVLLGVPPQLAADRAQNREREDGARRRDVYERDDELQRRTGEVYSGLAAAGFGGRWQIAAADVDPVALAGSLSR